MTKKFHHWKIGTINVQTAKEDQKLERVIHEIGRAGLSVCGIQESRRTKTGSAIITSTNDNNSHKYEIYWSGHSLKRIHGVAIAIKVEKNIIIEEIKPISARIVIADINLHGCSLRVINCYAPTEDDSSTSKDIFYAALRKQFNTEKTRKVICIGDFNATSSATWFNYSLREHVIIDNLEINNNGERFHNFFNTQKLSVWNTWFSHRKCRRITWHSPDGNTKKIYDFILSCSWIRQYVTNCRVHSSYDFDSDHRLVVANLKTPCSKLARYVKRTKKIQPKQFDLSALKIPEIGNDLKNEAINEMNSINLEADNSTLNKNLLKSINNAALNNLPKKANVKLYQPWHNGEKLKQII